MLLDSSFFQVDTIGFSGSRHGIDLDAGELAAAAVPAGAEVVVGCAAGVVAFFRSRFPATRVLRVDSSRSGWVRSAVYCLCRGGFSRSVGVVSWCGLSQWLIPFRVVWAVF